MGVNGSPGSNGTAGQSVVAFAEPVGPNCMAGGIRYVSASGNDYVCDGAPGLAGVTGERGEIGFSGSNGLAGFDGAIGLTGATGATGSEGAAGSPGSFGPTGEVGPIGLMGPAGTTGATGPIGLIGSTGHTGANGNAGAPGLNGQSVVAIPELAGGICANGGVGYASAAGIDYVCNGLTGATGLDGAPGILGEMGVQGATGLAGPEGAAGPTGLTGVTGLTGLTGLTGVTGLTGPTGLTGVAGSTGATGSQGVEGPQAAILSFGYFFALMPPDNSATIAPATAVEFPQDGAANGIYRSSASAFILPLVGVYEVSWQVSIGEPGQLVLGLDSGSGAVELPDTLAGRATGASQIVNRVLITTSSPNALLSVRNPTGNSVALTPTPVAGGNQAVSASLVIKQLL